MNRDLAKKRLLRQKYKAYDKKVMKDFYIALIVMLFFHSLSIGILLNDIFGKCQ